MASGKSFSGFTAFRENLYDQETDLKIWQLKETLEKSGKFLEKS